MHGTGPDCRAGVHAESQSSRGCAPLYCAQRQKKSLDFTAGRLLCQGGCLSVVHAWMHGMRACGVYGGKYKALFSACLLPGLAAGCCTDCSATAELSQAYSCCKTVWWLGPVQTKAQQNLSWLLGICAVLLGHQALHRRFLLRNASPVCSCHYTSVHVVRD